MNYRLIILLCLPLSAKPLTFTGRHLSKTGKENITRYTWDPKKTAVIICDMWDKHHCSCATRRVTELAPRIQHVASILRNQGALIIHCPSETMTYYANTPQRQATLAAPALPGSKRLHEKAKALLKKKLAKLPIDDGDGSCDDPTCHSRYDKDHVPWTRQIATIEIAEKDGIADGLEAYYFMKHHGITNVLIMGVHMNKCILKRPFGIGMLTAASMKTIFVRDLSDTMYNPHNWPYIDHFAANDLVTRYIEQYWCPTTTSDQLVGGPQFSFSEDRRTQ